MDAIKEVAAQHSVKGSQLFHFVCKKWHEVKRHEVEKRYEVKRGGWHS
jgi:hypothetical protein